MKKILVILAMMIPAIVTEARERIYSVTSPDGRNVADIKAAETLTWSVSHNGQEIIAPSEIGLILSDGRKIGGNVRVKNLKREYVNHKFSTPLYRKSEIHEQYNSLKLNIDSDFTLEVRAYDSGIAYRLGTTRQEEFTIKDEIVNFNLTGNHKAFIPYTVDPRLDERYCVSFESFYDESLISEMHADSLVICPMLIDLGDGSKLAIMDAGQEDYPGLFLKLNGSGDGLDGEFAPYPVEWVRNGADIVPTMRKDYIAISKGVRTYPWRVAVISDCDTELADNDLAMCLAPECRIEDTSWIRPGQSAWEWWNGINVKGVDFAVGSNTDTYKYYIDFAAENGMEYAILDGGWSAPGTLMKGHDGLDIVELARYAEEKNVGLVLWAAYPDMLKEYKEVIPHYAAMGIKGYKVDFFDRDDQVAIRDIYDMAGFAAEYHAFLDLHGMKAFGINRPYPNVIGYEGVRGLENFKWAPVVDDRIAWDYPRYDVTIPFVRALSGPMDYTPGAMDNVTADMFRTINGNPMSEGTRAHQMAMYTIFEAPFQMLADTPVKYRQNQDCTDFICSVPTVFDRTLILDGQVGEYIAVAKEKDGQWYVAAMTNRTPRKISIDLSFLGEGSYKAWIFSDGINANRNASDYVSTEREVSASDTLTMEMAPAGGWSAIISK